MIHYYFLTLFIYVALQIADVVSTELFIKNRVEEANPAVRLMMARGLWPFAKFLVMGVIVGISVFLSPNLYLMWALIAISVAQVYALWVNLRAAEVF